MTVTGNALFHAGITGKGKETLTQFLIYILEGECAEEIFPRSQATYFGINRMG